MYLAHFQLAEKPFSITPDPRFVYLSERHKDALAHLLYGLGQGGSGGFVVLTGEVGTGKTTLCRLALEQLPEGCEVALILNPQIDPKELLESICQELRIELPEASQDTRTKPLIDRLNVHLLRRYEQQKRVVVIIDEAQNLPRDTLEQLRLLTNLETATHKLLQIILLGQPELNVLLARDDLRQLAQRITARFHLGALNRTETASFIAHRLRVAGALEGLFDAAAANLIYRHSRGIPRVISLCADHALLATYTDGARTVSTVHVRQALREMHPLGKPVSAARTVLFAALALGLGAVVAWRFLAYAPRPATQTPIVQISQAAAPNAAAADSSTTALARWRTDAALPIEVSDSAQSLALHCPDRITTELRCAKGREVAARLRRLSRPVLLQTDQGFRLSSELQPAQDDLKFDFVALLRLPADVPIIFSAGYSGPGVSYLAQRLARVDQGPESQRIFGPRMQERLRRWQQANGMQADGIVGPMTWLLLAQTADPAAVN